MTVIMIESPSGKNSLSSRQEVHRLLEVRFITTLSKAMKILQLDVEHLREPFKLAQTQTLLHLVRCLLLNSLIRVLKL
jgi:hypothetical protein